MNRRAYQVSALMAMKTLRMFCLLWERQAGKSTELADMALFEMMKHVQRTCVYASASLMLATEIILKQVQRTDLSARELIQKESAALFESVSRYAREAKKAEMLFETADSDKDKNLKGISLDDFTELFESQRLEFRVYHDRTRYSRTKIIAANVATARGWSGTVFLDEIGFIKNFQELWIAIEPIISTVKEFKLIMSTTPPQDDTHYCFELLAPLAGTEFVPNAKGNWYDSDAGIRVHRADAYDTALAGKKIFDLKDGSEISVQESYRKAVNKQGWKINHGLQWLIGGTGAVSLLAITSAQERGIIAGCKSFIIEDDADYQAALKWLRENIHPQRRVGLGLDVATTTKLKSNPSVLSVAEENGPDVIWRAIFIWKTRDPDIARERVGGVIAAVKARPGGAARALAVDATNEKYFAEDVRKQFRAELPVILIVASETVDKPGLEKPTNWKEYSGDQYVSVLDDNRATLPPEGYIKVDHRLVMKDRGRFVCEPDAEGRHGDTFDGDKLALIALRENSNPGQFLPPTGKRASAIQDRRNREVIA